MPPLAANTVMTTAVTDLINALILLPMLLHMNRFLPQDHPESRLWKRLMGMIALSSLLGFVLHIHAWARVPLVCIWAVLYITLLDTVHAFLSLAIHALTGGDRPQKKGRLFLRAVELISWCVLVLFLLLGRNPIRLFILLAIGFALPALYVYARLARRGHRGARILLAAFLPQIPGLVLQLMRRGELALLWRFDFNGLYHLCVLVSIVIFYFSARQWNRDPALHH